MAELQYLLDTNILSDLVRNPKGPVTRRIARVGEATICTSVVVACALRYGAAKKGSARHAERTDDLLGSLEILPLGKGVDPRYASARLALERRGSPIGPNDLLIAAQALALDLILVTANVDEFSRVPGLHLENWLAPEPA